MVQWREGIQRYSTVFKLGHATRLGISNIHPHIPFEEAKGFMDVAEC